MKQGKRDWDAEKTRDGDGVVVVGKLNFWATRASLCVQILDLRPSLSAVLRQFEMMGVYPLNESVAIGRSRDKLRSLQLLARDGVGLPVTAFAQDSKRTDDLLDIVGGAPVVIKLLEGTQGIGFLGRQGFERLVGFRQQGSAIPGGRVSRRRAGLRVGGYGRKEQKGGEDEFQRLGHAGDDESGSEEGKR